MSDENNTIEIEVPETKTPEIVTLTELSDAGFDASEIETAKNMGIAVEQKTVQEPDIKLDKEKKAEEKNGSNISGQEKEKENLMFEKMLSDPKYETEMLKDLKPGDRVHGTYFAMKKERSRRQSAEMEKQHLDIKLKAKEKEIETLKKTVEDYNKKKAETAKEIGDDVEPEKIDLPEETPEQKAEKESAEKARLNEVQAAKLAEFELDAKSRYPDYDVAADLASDILKNANNLDKFFDSPREKAKVVHKLQQFLWAVKNADKFGENEYSPADMAYEIGMLHPNYKAPSSGGDKPGKKDEGLSPEELKRIEENSKRRTSASSSAGSGKRTVSFDDLTVEELAEMPFEQFIKIPQKHRDRLLAQ